MSAVLGGLTLLQLAELAAAVDGAALSLLRIHDELRAHGAQSDDKVPPHKQAEVDAVLRSIAEKNTADDFISSTLGR